MEKIKSILEDTSQRQYAMPDSPWMHYQEWHGIIFLHWQVDPEWVAQLLPDGLDVDKIEDRTWISIVAFTVRDLRLRLLPPFPYFSHFHEVNLRVYVTRDGRPGIYFLSIEAQKLVPVIMARLIFGLPYNKAKMKRGENKYFSETKSKDHFIDIEYNTDKYLDDKKALDIWLTERHCLYQERGKKLFRLDIHHKELELQELSVQVNKIRYWISGEKWPVRPPDVIHYAEKCEVVLWFLKTV